MASLNLALFHAIAAGFAPHPLALQIASAIALGSSWLGAAVLAWAAWRRPTQRLWILAALAVAVAAGMLAHTIAAALHFPRPFALGLSPAYIEHGGRAGLPSTHASVMFTIAFMLLARRGLRDVGLAMAAIALLTGWARIYVGVHFPLDVAAGALLGAFLAGAMVSWQLLARRLHPPAEQPAGHGASADARL
ncbi:MAG: phosphoesterase PA-phosphatase related [Variovorax sp.]|nr:phosphoesterase PA-phosphatase related [Variovorax sp.]